MPKTATQTYGSRTDALETVRGDAMRGVDRLAGSGGRFRRFRNGKDLSLRAFSEPEQALEAVGLRELDR